MPHPHVPAPDPPDPVASTLPPGDAPDAVELLGISELLAAVDRTESHEPARPASAVDRFAPPPPGPRFTLEGEIARGGMGVVWHGRDHRLARDVAVKVLHDTHLRTPQAVERFADEAVITGTLQHPGVVPVYDVGRLADGRPYFAMRRVHGRTLAEDLAARPHPAADRANLLRAFDQVCQTVAYAHARGVIHRDLKPTNVLLAEYGVVKVIDWGLAKRLGPCPDLPTPDAPDVADHCTLFGSVMGTPAYMAPEQATGATDRVDERADVFGLGAILCEILTGRPAYPGPRDQALDRAQRADLADAFDRLDGCRADGDLVALARRCLAPDPTGRPRDAGAVAAAMTAYLESKFRQAERDLVRFFDLSPDLFCIAGFDGYFRRVNANFTKLLGYSEAELVSRPYLEFVHPDDRAATRVEIDRVAHGLPVVRFRNRYRDARGSFRWFDWTSRSYEEEGTVYAVARDVTDILDQHDRG